MTRLFIDDKEISAPSNIFTLDQILKHIEDFHLPADSVVRQIQINGLAVLPEGLPEDRAEIVSRIGEQDKIEVFTGNIREVARDSIVEALAYLDRVETGTLSLAKAFQVSPGPDAFESLRQLYEGLYWLNVLLNRLDGSFQVNLEDVLIQEAPAAEYRRKFIYVLKQLVESQEKGDFVLISDLLEYEILPLVPVWREMLGIGAKKLNAPR
jgi:hypothetical protein